MVVRLRYAWGAIAAVIAAALFPVAAPAVPAPAPAWKLLAVTAPTNLPREQSEIQRIDVEATGGTFTLSRKTASGTGTPVTANGVLTVEKGSPAAVIVSGSYEIGERVSSAGVFPADTVVVSCSPDCTTKGSTVTLSNPSQSPNSGTGIAIVKLFTRTMSIGFGEITAPIHAGDELVAPGFATETVVTEVTPPTEATIGTLKTTKATTSAYSAGPLSFTANERTAPIAFDAAAGEVQAALGALAAFAPGAFAVAGGPGGDAGHPYLVTFGGELADRDVEPFEAGMASLDGEHAFVHVSTAVPGGPGTGELVTFPANVGGAPTSGTVKITVGPLPPGIVMAAPAEGEQWNCPTEAGLTTVTCTTNRSLQGLQSWGGAVRVPIAVTGSVLPGAEVPVEISGGGGGSDSYGVPIVVSDTPAAFGPAAFWAGSFEANGSPSTQAGGHPYMAGAYFVLNTVRSASGQAVPAGDSREVVVDLPPGFTGNPLVTARCPQSLLAEPFSGPTEVCNRQSMSIGTVSPLTGAMNVGTQFTFGLFNDVPPTGYAAEFTTRIITPLQSVLGSLRSEEDFGVRITAPENPTYQKLFGAFTAIEGQPGAAHGKAFLTNPSDCEETVRQAPLVRSAGSSWQGQVAEETRLPQPVLTGCDKLAIHPNFAFQPSSAQGSSPVGATAHLHLPQEGLVDPDQLAEPPLRRSVVKLPAGLSLNPSQANGLEACTEAEIGYKGAGDLPNPTRFTDAPVSCPDGSKLGTVEATSPLLDEPVTGTIYLARQDENPFHTLIGLYLVIESERFGIRVKLPGKVLPDPATGQLTAVFDYIPQLPVEDLTLRFRGGGPLSELATPEVCGTYTTSGEWEPWSAPESGPPARTEDSFAVSQGCSSSASSRPFHPDFEAGTTNPLAGAYSPLVIKVSRRDGEQELSSLDFTLPLGLTAKLAGIPDCSDSAIAAAGGKSGREELADPSCPAASQIGTVDAASGVGSQPFHVGGKAYLAGPYKGAPISTVVITPAVAGPFDLGDVVIRTPLYVDPQTAQVTAKSDPVPTILKGIPLKLRSVRIDIDRSGFALNPTSCEVKSASALLGGSSGATARPSNRFQVGGCGGLKFKPHLNISLKGGTGRTGHPALKAVLNYPSGSYANIARAQVGLPHSEFLDQGSLNKTCTRPVLLAGNCPPSTVYGHAEAWTPLLDQPLRGPVYLVGGFGYKLPAVVADLNGQIRFLLVGRVDTTKQGGIRNTFEVVPDAPVSRFVLTLKGGKKYGLFENSENLCSKKQFASARFVAQNGRVAQLRPRIANSCKRKHGPHGTHPGSKAPARHKGKNPKG
jgi:hypothetical protein